MSASDKKKLRKEQNAASLTEKQQKELKEVKKLKAYTISFVVVMVLVVAIIAGVTLRPSVAGVINRATNAVTVGSHTLSTTELSFFYSEAINSFVQQFSGYGDYAALYMQMSGLNPSLPLDEQVLDKAAGTTWADYFINSAKESAKWTYTMYDAAMAAGFTLSAEDQKSLDNLEANLEFYAMYAGYSSVSAYLRNVYGDGANLKNYTEYYRLTLIASEYASQYRDGLKFADEDFRAHEKDKMQEYNSYSYTLHKLNTTDYLKFLGLGTVTKDENGKETTTYSAEDKKKAAEAALADAKLLTAEGITDVEKLNAAINALNINNPKKEEKAGETDTEDKKEETKKPLISATENKHILYSKVLSNTNEGVQKWLSDAARKAGDVTYVEISTGEGDKKEVTGYFVVMFNSVNENKYHTADVQHILVKFEGGKKDADGNTIYSQAEKDKAKAEAQAILDGFLKETRQDSEVFGVLAKEKSEDTGTKNNNGLIADINLGSGYVDPFTTWALAEHKVGDTGLIETEYGWHVMFYKATSELTYRDQMINTKLVSDAYTAWEDALLKTVTVTDHNLNGLDTDYVISPQ